MDSIQQALVTERPTYDRDRKDPDQGRSWWLPLSSSCDPAKGHSPGAEERAARGGVSSRAGRGAVKQPG